MSFEVSSFRVLDSRATLGSSSIRRRAQILNYRKDLNIIDFRGNVQTRIKKLRNNEVSGTVLAMAGLKRLNISNVPFNPIEVEEMIPAVAQGVIGVERRFDDFSTAYILEKINDSETTQCVNCERAYLEKLDGSCQTPIAGFAIKENGNIKFIEKSLLTIIALLTIVATGQVIVKIYNSGTINLADLLLLFIYTEVLGMIGVFYTSNRIPITLPLFIAMTAISRLIILQGKGMDASTLLYEAGAILIIALACLAVRYRPSRSYHYQNEDDSK